MTRTIRIIVTIAPIAVLVAFAVGCCCGWVAYREWLLSELEQMRF